MNIPKILKTFFIVILLGTVILLGCTTGQKTPASQNSSTPTDQNGDAGGDTGTSIVDEPGGTEETSISDSEEAASIRVLVADKITTLDPYRMVSTHPDGSVASHLWDTLTLLNNNLQIEPRLAESWRLVNNFTWEIKLREGITFHNGEPLDAEAVRFSIARAQSMSGSLETFAEDISLDQVEVVDEYTLRLTTRQPVVNLPYHLAFLEILPPAYYSGARPDQLAIAPIGSGPYKLSEWNPNGELVLEAVQDYWKGTPTISRLIFQTVPDAKARVAALQNREAELVTDLPPIREDQWDVVNGRLETIENTQRMFIGIQIEEGSPLADRQVRQALNYGVNVEQIVNDWLEGYGERYGSWVNPPSDDPELAPWPYDPEQARELLAEAGYSEGITITLRTPVGVYDHDVDITQTIAQQLSQIGITAEVEPISSWEIYTRDLLNGDMDSLFLLGLNSRGDALEDVKNLSAGFAFNPVGWHNESFEEVLRQAVNTFNEDSRKRLLDEAQGIAYEEAPWIWLWRQYDFYGVSQRLDWTPRRDGLIYLYKPILTPAESD